MAVPLSVSLLRFRLVGIESTERTIGDGSYATVLEYTFRGLVCVGKRIHELLYAHASPAQKGQMLQRFEEECELLSQLRHPNIVQFLGVHAEPGSALPVLVMEYLPTGNLSGYLDGHGALPDDISYGILRDVALGLRYLHEHTPPIIHRDLSANNVLLTTSLSAKISDLGVAKILNLSPSQMSQRMSTKAPGTPCYMPPEALIDRPNYTSKIDSYSFGVLILHVFCGEWPFPTDAFQPDPRDPTTFVPVTEVDRRSRFIRRLGNEHPLLDLVRECLSNSPVRRLEVAEIFRQLDNILQALQAQAGTVIQQLESVRHENQRLVSENALLSSEVAQLSQLSQTQETEIDRQCTENESLTGMVNGLRNENQALLERIRTELHSTDVAASQQLRSHEPSTLSLATTNASDQLPTCCQLHAGTRLQWRRCADAPVEMYSAHAVVVGEKVYVGAGVIHGADDHRVFQYNCREDIWDSLPRCPAKYYALANFMGSLIAVGGTVLHGITGKVHTFTEAVNRWEELLPPMPTPRHSLSVTTTSALIVAAGGDTVNYVLRPCSTVEVYSTASSQWHTADPLPAPCADMSLATINDTCYLLGGSDDILGGGSVNCFHASIGLLMEKIDEPTLSLGSIWKRLPNTPIELDTAILVSLNGSLMAVGGKNENGASLAVYAYINNVWLHLKNGDLPAPREYCTAASPSPDKVIIIGGFGETVRMSNKVFMGTIVD